jgi:hypothetical protein
MNLKDTPTYDMELNTDDLFTLEQFLKAVRACGSMDWGHREFRAIIHVKPVSEASHAALRAFVLEQDALGIAGLSLDVSPKIA